MKHEEGEVPINVKSFKGSGVVVRVAKQPGMENVDLLIDKGLGGKQRKNKGVGKHLEHPFKVCVSMHHVTCDMHHVTSYDV